MATCDGPDGSEARQALYLYCVARAGGLPAIDAPGIDEGSRVELAPWADLVAVVSLVRVDDFCGPSSEARMGDLAWVGARVCRHQAVVEAVMAHCPVVPASFAVLFSSIERLTAWLETHHDAISRALDRFARHEEWAVRVTLDRRTAEAQVPDVTGVASDPSRSTPAGVRYLRERSARLGAGPKLEAWLRDACTVIVGDLLHHAAEFRERAVVRGPSETDGRPVANWAFLVPRSERAVFAARVESIHAGHVAQGLSLGLSGPWPPYSFRPRFESEPS